MRAVLGVLGVLVLTVVMTVLVSFASHSCVVVFATSVANKPHSSAVLNDLTCRTAEATRAQRRAHVRCEWCCHVLLSVALGAQHSAALVTDDGCKREPVKDGCERADTHTHAQCGEDMVAACAPANDGCDEHTRDCLLNTQQNMKRKTPYFWKYVQQSQPATMQVQGNNVHGNVMTAVCWLQV
jgi:hypothetical protein